ncbi:GNAT family N-acetyltransferase [Pedobacter insulae]|uniref:Acetyltransferase (GNAT) family protein n=1 Tax=Pedobacter insulae TaxID=414048 RepID=A0A1I2UWC4_9SPHI|nr:GNAT family N-acetyltransferase [Pedobacter insulae]SFG80479.1 Acetyltransferase (GNAT) family protein [Pedobacter insulae]
MAITKAVQQDIKELNSLINAAYRGDESKKGWTTEAEILDGIRINEVTLADLLSNAAVSILKYTNEDGKIVGTVYLELKPEQLYLGMFAVSPISQGKGIGKAFLAAAEVYALANNCNRIILTVISSRTELIDWYKRHGYMATGGSIAFEEIEGRFGEPKVPTIKLIEMEKLL